MTLTKKLTRVISFGFLIAANISYTKSALAVSETFYNPRVQMNNGRTYDVSLCVKSPRYSNPCTQTTAALAAKAFCLTKRYNNAIDYQLNESNLNRHAVLTEEYRGGQLRTGWRVIESKYYFTKITCNSQ